VRRHFGFSWGVILLAAILALPGVIKRAHAAGLAVSEELLVKLPPEVAFDEIVAAEDGSRVAFVAPRDGDQCMIVNGVKGPAYFEVGTPFISPSGLLVYFAERDHKTYIVINDKECGPYAELDDHLPTFSPDGKHVAFTVRQGEQWSVVADGRPGKSYDGIVSWKMGFSPDSQHLAYIATRGPKHFFVVDGRELGEDNQTDEYDVSEISFSPDSRRTAWLVGARGNQAVVVDGVKDRDYLSVGDITFSEDSRHLAYLAGEKNNTGVVTHLVLDGRVVASSPHIENFSLSRDGKRFAFREIREGKNYAVVEVVATECGAVMDDPIIFSPDGKHVAFISDKGLMVDGQNLGPGGGPVFSPDSKRLVFARRRDNKTFVVSDGRESKGYDNLLTDNSEYLNQAFFFSPDCAHLAYLAVDEGKPRVVLDGTEQDSFGRVDPATIRFSADSRHLAYVAQQNGKFRLIGDGQAGPEYEALYGKVGFDSGKTIRALARRGDELLRVRVKLTDFAPAACSGK
jgi:Tol biopolymer transport system component